jgi:hypothetical protein
MNLVTSQPEDQPGKGMNFICRWFNLYAQGAGGWLIGIYFLLIFDAYWHKTFYEQNQNHHT